MVDHDNSDEYEQREVNGAEHIYQNGNLITKVEEDGIIYVLDDGTEITHEQLQEFQETVRNALTESRNTMINEIRDAMEIIEQSGGDD